jgi:hypothetical protein
MSENVPINALFRHNFHARLIICLSNSGTTEWSAVPSHCSFDETGWYTMELQDTDCLIAPALPLPPLSEANKGSENIPVRRPSSPRYPWNISQQAGPKSEDCFCGICDPFFHASFSIRYWRGTHHHLSRISPNMLTTCYRIWWTSPPNWQPVWDHQKSSNRNWWWNHHSSWWNPQFEIGGVSTRSQPPSCDLVGCSTAPW